MRSNLMQYCAVLLRVFLGLALVSLVALGLIGLGGEGVISLWLTEEDHRWWALILTSLAYMVLLAVPFVPGVELGWLIIGVFGRVGILMAWAATVLGLSISFALANWLRDRPLLNRIQASRARLMSTPAVELSVLRRALQYGVCFYVKHPYIFLFLTLNLPGNWVIGGGGGIAAMTGLAPGVRYWRFLPTVMVATGILPLLLWFGLA